MALKKLLYKIPAVAALTLCLQSCVLYPPYQQPIVDVPIGWRFSAEESSTFANIRWWERFGDPVLDRLIQEALDYNNDIKVAVWNVEQFYANVGIVSSRLYPQVFGNAIAQKNETSLTIFPRGADVKRITDDFRLNMSFSFELDIWGRIRSATDVAVAELYASQEVQKTVVLTVVSSVAQAYILLREYDRDLQISRDTLDSRQKSFELAKLRYEEGFTSELEVKQAESEVENAAVRLVEFERLIAQQENLISILVGHAPSPIERGLNAKQWHQPPTVPAGLPSELLRDRPDIVEAEMLLRAANAQIGVAWAEFFPDISLTGFFGFESLHLKDLLKSASRTWQYGANLLQAIYTGGRITSQVAQAEADKWKAYYSYIGVVLNAFKEVEDALIGYQKSQEEKEIQLRRVKVLQEYLDLATLQYDNGQTDYLNVLDAERNLFAAQLDLSLAESGVFMTLVNIYKATAGGWVVDANDGGDHDGTPLWLSGSEFNEYCGGESSPVPLYY